MASPTFNRLPGAMLVRQHHCMIVKRALTAAVLSRNITPRLAQSHSSFNPVQPVARLVCD